VASPVDEVPFSGTGEIPAPFSAQAVVPKDATAKTIVNNKSSVRIDFFFTITVPPVPDRTTQFCLGIFPFIHLSVLPILAQTGAKIQEESCDLIREKV